MHRAPWAAGIDPAAFDDPVRRRCTSVSGRGTAAAYILRLATRRRHSKRTCILVLKCSPCCGGLFVDWFWRTWSKSYCFSTTDGGRHSHEFSR